MAINFCPRWGMRTKSWTLEGPDWSSHVQQGVRRAVSARHRRGDAGAGRRRLRGREEEGGEELGRWQPPAQLHGETA